MIPHAILALLTDEAGRTLLVRRKDSALWALPGGTLRPSADPVALLISCCRRQVGVGPDFVAPPIEMFVAGRTFLVARDEIPHERARACGRVEESRWFAGTELPLNVAPVARMIIINSRLIIAPVLGRLPFAFASSGECVRGPALPARY